MIWFILILVAVVGIFTTKRTVFVAALIVLFLSIGIQRTFTEFELPVGVTFEGTEVVETTEVCGKAIPLLLNFGDQQADLASGLRRNCLKAGRTRVVEAFIAIVVGLVWSSRGMANDPCAGTDAYRRGAQPAAAYRPETKRANRLTALVGPMTRPSQQRLISALCGSSHRHQGAQGPSRQSVSL